MRRLYEVPGLPRARPPAADGRGHGRRDDDDAPQRRGAPGADDGLHALPMAPALRPGGAAVGAGPGRALLRDALPADDGRHDVHREAAPAGLLRRPLDEAAGEPEVRVADARGAGGLARRRGVPPPADEPVSQLPLRRLAGLGRKRERASEARPALELRAAGRGRRRPPRALLADHHRGHAVRAAVGGGGAGGGPRRRGCRAGGGGAAAACGCRRCSGRGRRGEASAAGGGCAAEGRARRGCR
mmetsp:Transcript_117075/g.327621  ORF Transcript_117075/g.327621 Transcript_117075/m.327621 type:complete len:243 (-) Transcript_117075:251-979(-)